MYLLGDWNVIMERNMCSKEPSAQHIGRSRECKGLFEEQLNKHRIIQPCFNFTYTKKDYKSRLDTVYTKKVDAQKILQYEIIPMVLNDHDQVKIVVKWGDRPR